MPKRAPISPASDPPWEDLPRANGDQPMNDDPIVATGLADDPAQNVPPSGRDEFKAETTSNPGKGNPRRATGKRKAAAAGPEPGAADGSGSPPGAESDQNDPGEQRLRALESGEQELQFHSLDDLNEHLKVMYFGQEGTRKTTNALQMTKLGPGKVLLVNAEGGAKKTPLRKHGVDTARVMVWPPQGERVSFVGLEKLFYRIMAELMDDPTSWLGTVWDSATDIHQALLDQVVESDIARQQEIIAKNKGRRPGNVVLRDRFDTDRDDYKVMSNQFRLLLRKFRDLPCHFVVTALLRTDEVARRAVRGPAVTPAIGTDLMGYMDQVLFTQVARFGEAYVGFAQTVPDETTRAKDRFDVLPTELPNPSVDRLYAYVIGDLTATTDPDLSLLSTTSPAVKAAVASKQAVRRGGADTEVGAAVKTESAKQAVKADIAAHEEPTPATKTAAARRTSGKRRTSVADPVPSGGPDDQPPY